MSSEYEEYTDSEEEETGPRLKPVFVRRCVCVCVCVFLVQDTCVKLLPLEMFVQQNAHF